PRPSQWLWSASCTTAEWTDSRRASSRGPSAPRSSDSPQSSGSVRTPREFSPLGATKFYYATNLRDLRGAGGVDARGHGPLDPRARRPDPRHAEPPRPHVDGARLRPALDDRHVPQRVRLHREPWGRGPGVSV